MNVFRVVGGLGGQVGYQKAKTPEETGDGHDKDG
jgi:hypothetical protein